ncbi:MAG: adenosylcobinamide-phosphate synthase CbiB [Spirochaetota bacterium]
MIFSYSLPFHFQLLLALVLDSLIGDPQWMPHPVRLVGFFAQRFEKISRMIFRNLHVAGFFAWITVVLLTASISILFLKICVLIHPVLGDIFSVVLLYYTVAVRDLVKHGTNVFKALDKGNLKEARQRLSLIVSRDTAGLDEQGIVRSAVESITENTVDGITSPLFFAALGGPVGAVLYRAVNTMDAMFGYKNERYREFGFISARADDILNFIPARITGVFMCFSAFIIGENFKNAFRILRRDHARHASPNGGYPESAAAGALGIRIGGPNRYFGTVIEKPFIGDEIESIQKLHIKRALKLCIATTLLFAGCTILFRTVV